MAEAMQLVRRGRVPSVAEVAVAAGVSRATAYRYFRDRSELITAVVEESLGPVRSFEPQSTGGRERVLELFDETFPRFKEFEPHLRAALGLALEHQAMESAGLLEEPPYRRGHRREILRRAMKPMRSTLAPRSYDRLLKALSLVYGIESYVVLKDIWALADREVESVARWMVDALIAHATRPAEPPAVTSGGTRGRPAPRR